MRLAEEIQECSFRPLLLNQSTSSSSRAPSLDDSAQRIVERMRKATAERQLLAKRRELRSAEIYRPLKIASEPFSFGDGCGKTGKNFRSASKQPLATVLVEVATSDRLVGKIILRRHDDVSKVVRRFAVGNSLTLEQEQRLLKQIQVHVAKEDTWKLNPKNLGNSNSKLACASQPETDMPIFPTALSPPAFDFNLMPLSN